MNEIVVFASETALDSPSPQTCALPSPVPLQQNATAAAAAAVLQKPGILSKPKASFGGSNNKTLSRFQLAYTTYDELVASKKDFKRMTAVSYDRTLNCKRIIVEMVKVLIKPVYMSNRIDKPVYKYVCESVTNNVSDIVRTSADYDYKLVPFLPSPPLFIEVTRAIHKALGTHS